MCHEEIVSLWQDQRQFRRVKEGCGQIPFRGDVHIYSRCRELEITTLAKKTGSKRLSEVVILGVPMES
jgi:hypothetical protein